MSCVAIPSGKSPSHNTSHYWLHTSCGAPRDPKGGKHLVGQPDRTAVGSSHIPLHRSPACACGSDSSQQPGTRPRRPGQPSSQPENAKSCQQCCRRHWQVSQQQTQERMATFSSSLDSDVAILHQQNNRTRQLPVLAKQSILISPMRLVLFSN